MTAEFRLLLRPELHAQLRALEQPARETLQAGLRALAEGREHEYGGEPLGYSPSTFDLRDCAQLKLGSHFLIYRELDTRTREAVCFEHHDPYVVAAKRLGRMAVRPDAGLLTFPEDLRDTLNAAWNPSPARGAVSLTPQTPTASAFRNHAASERQAGSGGRG